MLCLLQFLSGLISFLFTNIKYLYFDKVKISGYEHQEKNINNYVKFGECERREASSKDCLLAGLYATDILSTEPPW